MVDRHWSCLSSLLLIHQCISRNIFFHPEILPRKQEKTLDINGVAVTLWDSQKSTLQHLMRVGHITEGKQPSSSYTHNIIYLLDDLVMPLVG